jgi:hypothetical protein
MKKLITAIACLFFISAAGTALAEQAPQKVIDLAQSKLASLGTDPVIIEAVKAQNAQSMTLDQIKTKDAQWKGTAGVVDYMQALMDSKCGKHLGSMVDAGGYYAEIFVMDNQGANVCMSDKTSDYWQGDESKFQKSFNNGAGAVFVDEVEFDDSTQAYQVQVSVPVKDGGNVIGAITFGIDVDAI